MAKVIPTTYRGIRYRSRLEARWAVLFTTLGIKFEYEKEGYILDNEPYLPDFWLPELGCFVEIKGDLPTKREQEVAFNLSRDTGKVVHMFCGQIPEPGIESWSDSDFESFTYDYSRAKENLGNQKYLKRVYSVNQCPKCGKVGFSNKGMLGDLPCGCMKGNTMTKQSPLVQVAFRSARAAQFEFRS